MREQILSVTMSEFHLIVTTGIVSIFIKSFDDNTFAKPSFLKYSLPSES